MTEIFEGLAVIGDLMKEEDRVVHLLASLPRSFDMLVTALESNIDVPKFEIVTEKLLHEERKIRGEVELDSSNERALAVGKFKGKGSYNNEPREITCYKCGRSGHIQRFCQNSRNGNMFNGSRKRETANMLEVKNQRYDESSSESETGFVVENNHAMNSTANIKKIDWIMDSGATSHMCNDERWFSGELRKLEEPELIKIGNGNFVRSLYVGNVDLNMKVGEEYRICTLYNVFYVPDLYYNLISVSRAVAARYSVRFEDKNCYIRNRSSKVIAVAKRSGNLWFLDCQNYITSELNQSVNVASKNSNQNLKYNLGHFCYNSMNRLLDESKVEEKFHEMNIEFEKINEPAIEEEST